MVHLSRRAVLNTTLILLLAVILGYHVAKNRPQTTTVRFGSASYNLETVTTSAAKAKGLSGRVGMADYNGMLFAYPNIGVQCFWMKDMRFSLDIIWIDDAHRIVKMQQNLSPKTYPKSYCAPAQFVVELNAGQASRAHLGVGQTAYGL